MSSFEQPFIEAIEDGSIEGVLIEGRSKSGKSYSKALGSRTLLDGTKKPLARTDLLFLASATKLLTTIAMLQCAERGYLFPDDDVFEHLPEVPEFSVLLERDESKRQSTFERLTRPPGDGWVYGTGLDWAGLMVERITAKRLDEYFRQYIFRPLGCSDTEASFFPVSERLGDRMVDLNPKDPKGEGLSASMGTSIHDEFPGHCYGGGGAYGSTEAYMAVLRSLLLNDDKLLMQSTVAMMFEPQLAPKAKASLAETLKNEWAPYFNMGTTGNDPNHGFGGLLVTEDDDGSGMGKGTLTWGGGVNTAWFIDPTNEIAGFLSLQLGIPADAEKGLELKASFRRGLKEVLA